MKKKSGGFVRIGVTGGFGTGKSTALRLLQGLGAAVLDTDRLAHQLIRPGWPAYWRIVRHFGAGILKRDRTIDRTKLGAIVFASARQRKVLNSLVHPPILREMRRFLANCRRRGRWCALSVPLLFETGSGKYFDRVLVVKAGPGVVYRRAGKQRGLSRKQIRARIRAQMPLGRKCRLADAVLDNNGSLGASRKRLALLVQKWRGGN